MFPRLYRARASPIWIETLTRQHNNSNITIKKQNWQLQHKAELSVAEGPCNARCQVKSCQVNLGSMTVSDTVIALCNSNGNGQLLHKSRKYHTYNGWNGWMTFNINQDRQKRRYSIGTRASISWYFVVIYTRKFANKSSAVAEMGDRGHNRHGPKTRGLLCTFREGSWIPI